MPAAVLIDETANLPPAERRIALAMADRPTIWTVPEAETFIKELIDGGLG